MMRLLGSAHALTGLCHPPPLAFPSRPLSSCLTHQWYAWIAYVAALGSASLVAGGAPLPRELIEVMEQVAGDATLLSPVWCFTYLVVMSLLEGINPEGVKDRLRVRRDRERWPGGSKDLHLIQNREVIVSIAC